MSITVRLFGRPQITVGTGTWDPPAGKTAAMLYCLAFHGDWVRRETLAYLFWPETTENAAKLNLRQLLATVKRFPHVDLETNHDSVRWQVASDVRAFQEAYGRGDRAAMIAAYTGPLLQGLNAEAWSDFNEWLEHTRAELTARFCHEAVAFAENFERLGRVADAARALARVHELEPLHEPSLRAYLRLLHASEQRSKLSAVFETFEHQLEDLGGEAEAETVDLVKRLSAEQGALSVPPRHNLLTPTSAFVGREGDKTALHGLLGDPFCRLLTLVGPGGIGKTRLALEVAADLVGSEAFPDGVWFVPLAPVLDEAFVAPSIAAGVGLSLYGSDSEAQLESYLRERATLLVLDNAEHLSGVPAIVAGLLDACPRLRCFVTSREALGVYGEHEYPVPALTMPYPGQQLSPEELRSFEAVEVFVQRAQAVQPGFSLSPENAPAVVELCHRLDGLPLALELAAARMRLFTPQALATRLGRRLDVLTGGPRTLPPRQQTLRRAVGWSYDLLAPHEQTLFRRLAVFVSGCTLETIEAVCTPRADTLETTDSLVRKSLLRQTVGSDGEPRFSMLETLHAFATEALEKSGESDAVRRTHAEFFTALAERAEPHLKDPEQALWLGRLEAEHDNFRAALSWTEGHDRELGLRLAGLLYMFWEVRGHVSEGRTWLEAALAKNADAQPAVRAKALNAAGVLARRQGDDAVAHTLLEESLAIYRALGDKERVASLLNNLAITAEIQEDYRAARSDFEEALGYYRELDDGWGMAMILNNLGNVVLAQDGPRAARPVRGELRRVSGARGQAERDDGARQPRASDL